ncbi:XRE family transcriptional regulator [Variovorax sp. VNK109]|uniref:XRE family transcriptional regulator n=1 Tax=Variovorax sp. VNK109 TaxID=3400919 RepID=UPI003BFA907C
MDTQKRGSTAHEDVQASTAIATDDNQKAARYAADFSDRVRTLRGAISRQDFALKLGIHANTVGKFERGETMPDAWLIHRMCLLGKRTAQWLITGQPAATDMPDKSLHAVESSEFVWVPLFDIQAAAGDGAFNDLERVTAMRPFDIGFIRGELGIPHNEIAMCQIIGNSASPRLNSRDSVLLDRRDREVHTEGMHIVRLDGALLAKRLQRMPGRKLLVSSTNEEYSPFEISGSDDHDRDFAVIGRVRWGGVIFQ